MLADLLNLSVFYPQQAQDIEKLLMQRRAGSAPVLKTALKLRIMYIMLNKRESDLASRFIPCKILALAKKNINAKCYPS